MICSLSTGSRGDLPALALGFIIGSGFSPHVRLGREGELDQFADSSLFDACVLRLRAPMVLFHLTRLLILSFST